MIKKEEGKKKFEIEFIDKGDHIYFELDEDSFGRPFYCHHHNDFCFYEFEYKYKKYVCKLSNPFEGFIDNLNCIITEMGGNNRINRNVHCERGTYESSSFYKKSRYDISKEVVEVIYQTPSSPYFTYYVVHSIEELDYDEILNQTKFLTNSKNLETLKNVFKIYNDPVTKYVNLIVSEQEELKEKIRNIVKESKKNVEKINREHLPSIVGFESGDFVICASGRVLLVGEINDYSNYGGKLFNFNYDNYGGLYFPKNKFDFKDLSIQNLDITFNCSELKKGKFKTKGEYGRLPIYSSIIHNFGKIDLENRKEILRIQKESKHIHQKYLDDNKEEFERRRAILKKEYEEYDRQFERQNPTKTYLMKNKRNGYYKIGKTANPKYRERTLQSQEPNTEFVKIWDCDIEKILHDNYSKQRVRGEWFKLTKIQVEFICRKDWSSTPEES